MILFLFLLIVGYITFALVSALITSSNNTRKIASSNISSTVTSNELTSQVSSSTNPKAVIISVLNYIDKPMIELSKTINVTRTLNNNLRFENGETDIYIESTDQITSSYVQVIFKQVPPCEPDITILDRVNGLIQNTDLQPISDVSKISNPSAISGSALYIDYMDKYYLRISASPERQCLLTLYRM